MSMSDYTRNYGNRLAQNGAKKNASNAAASAYAATNRNNVEDPHGNYFFELEIGGAKVATFMECSGLKTAAQVFEVEEGGMNGRTHKRPGQSRWENIVLRFASSGSQDLLKWRDEYLQDQFANVKDGTITLFDNYGQPVRQWSFKRAWPVSWEGPKLDSGQSELAVETLEIAHDGLTTR